MILGFSDAAQGRVTAERIAGNTLVTPQKRQITMINAELKTNGNQLTITVDLSKEHGPSKSGKTIIIATSSGNQKIEGTDAIIGLNIYRKRT